MIKKRSLFIPLISILSLLLIVSIIYSYLHKMWCVKINKSAIVELKYITCTPKNEVKEYDISSSLTDDDIYKIIKELNNGTLKPDEDAIINYSKERIEIVTNDRTFSINNQGNGYFTVIYPRKDKGASVHVDDQTTLKSKILESYFEKFKKK